MSAVGRNLRIELSRVFFWHNKADEGGALFIKDSRPIKGNNIGFIANSAIAGGAVLARYTLNNGENDGKLIECHSCKIIKNKAHQPGRYIFFSLRSIEWLLSLSTLVTTTVLLSVGIINVETSSYKDILRPEDSDQAYLSDKNLIETVLLLNHTTFEDNRVGGYESVLLVSSLPLLEVCCGELSTCIRATNIKQSTCSLNKRNKYWRDADQTGPESGFIGRPLKKMAVLFSPNETARSAHKLMGLTVDLQDHLGISVVTRGILSVQLLQTTNASLSGQPTEGIRISKKSSIEDLELRGEPGLYGLQFSFAPEATGPHLVENISIPLRECVIGEVTKDLGRLCEKCEVDYYSFDPMQPNCLPCPEHAECSGSTLTPLNGYWHNNSQSSMIHKCLHKLSCVNTNRTIILAEKARSAAHALTLEHNYPQCSKVMSIGITAKTRPQFHVRLCC